MLRDRVDLGLLGGSRGLGHLQPAAEHLQLLLQLSYLAPGLGTPFSPRAVDHTFLVEPRASRTRAARICRVAGQTLDLERPAVLAGPRTPQFFVHGVRRGCGRYCS